MTGAQTTPGVCNNTALRKAARYVTRYYDTCLAESGLRGTQYAILSLLASRGSATIAELAETLVMDRATMGHNLRPLERDGLLEMRVGQRDRRERAVILSKKGIELEAKGKVAWEHAQRRFESAFGKEDALAMRRIMSRIASLDL